MKNSLDWNHGMKLPISLCASVFALCTASAALADTPTPESFEEFQIELRTIEREAAEISGTPSINRGIKSHTDQLNSVKAKQRQLESVMEKAGEDIDAMKAEARELDDQWPFSFGDAASTAGGDAASSTVTRGLSAGAKKLASYLGWAATFGEYAYRLGVKEQTEDQLEEFAAQQQVSLEGLREVWFFQQSAINQLVGELNTLEDLKKRHDRTFREMGERYPAQVMNQGRNARDAAKLDRVTDKAGDEALRQEALRDGIRRADGKPPVWDGSGKPRIKIGPASQSNAFGNDPQNSGASAGGNPVSIVGDGGTDKRRTLGGLYAGATYMDYEIMPFGVGVVLREGGEDFVAETGDSFDSFGFGGGAEYYTPKIGGFSISISYFEEEGVATGTVAENTDVTGNVNLDFNPNNGSTGILFGPAGLDAQIAFDHDYLEIGSRWIPPEALQPLPGGIQGALTLEWTRVRQNFSAFAEPPAFGGAITDMRDIGFNNYFVDFVIEFTRAIDLAFFGPRRGLMVTPYASIGGTYYKSKFDAMETFECSLCGPDDNFSLQIEDERDGLTWNANIGMKLDLGLTDTISLSADARYEWRGATPVMFIPRTGDDLFLDNRTAGLEDGDETGKRFSAMIGVKYNF